MCNPNQFRACAAFCWSNQVAQVVRTAFSANDGNEARRLTSQWRSQEPQRWWQWVNIPSILPCLFGSSCGSSNFMTKLATSQVRLKSRSGGRPVATNIFCVKCSLNAAHVLGTLADPAS